MTDREAAGDPETKLNELYRLADDYPREVLANPIMALLQIGQPEEYNRINLRCIMGLMWLISQEKKASKTVTTQEQ